MNFIFIVLDHLDRHAEEYRIGILNASALVVSTTSTQKWLQIILLFVSIIYTTFKTVEIIEKRRKAKNDRKNEN